MTPKDLFEVGQREFERRTMLLSMWQEISLNFYPERADFTFQRTLGSDFASNLTTSYPILARRELQNTLGTMLRPTAKEWFHMRTPDVRLDNDVDARQWLEWAEQVQRRAMYARAAQFTRATKEGDGDFAAFGQCVISVQLNKAGDDLLYRSWHLRDCAWREDETGAITQFWRRWKPTARDLKNLFGEKVHSSVNDALNSKNPFQEFNVYHVVVPSYMCDYKTDQPYCSIWFDADHQIELGVTGSPDMVYVVPRWQTVSGSQYAFSPAAVAGLPDARLLQAMTMTLLEAGEKLVNPPMIGVAEAIRSDISLYAGGFTAVDADYDERMGEVLRPLTQDHSSMPLGVEMQRDCKAMLMEAFFLNKFQMPQRAAEMTAFEVGQRVQEYIRQAMPIFEPMEAEYNGALCDRTFDVLMRGGAFGSPHDMPKSLRAAQIEFGFESPLHDAIGAMLSQKFIEAKALLADAIALDPGAAVTMNIKTALRESLLGAGVPASWQKTPAEIDAAEAAQKAAANAQQILSLAQQGADVAKTLGDAQQGLNGPTMTQNRMAQPANAQVPA